MFEDNYSERIGAFERRTPPFNLTSLAIILGLHGPWRSSTPIPLAPAAYFV